MLHRFTARVWDRKWMLLIWLLFLAALAVLHPELFQTPALIALVALLFACSLVCILMIQGTSARDFLLIACLMGLFFIVIAPFTCVVDEEYHFARAFNLSEGHLFHYYQDGTLGYDILSDSRFVTKPEYWNLLNLWQDSGAWLTCDYEVVFSPRIRTASYLPLDYIFSAVGIGAARLFRLPLLATVLLGRLTNYAAYVAVAWLAIRSAKHYRSLFFLIAVLPCCLYAGATINIDAPLIAFSLLYVSISLNYCLDGSAKRISARDIVLLLTSAAFILSTKYFGYCLLLPLILFAAKRGLKNFKSVLLMLGGMTLLIGVWQVWALLAFSGSVDAGASVVQGVDTHAQLAWILENKGEFITMAVRDFMQNLVTRLYLVSFSEVPAFSFVALPLRFLPFIAAARATDKYPLSLTQRRSFNAYWILAAAAMMLMCNIGLYLSWTPVGANEIGGVQYRYTLPYMIFILLAFSTLSPENHMKNWDRRICFLSCLALINMITGSMLNYL